MDKIKADDNFQTHVTANSTKATLKQEAKATMCARYRDGARLVTDSLSDKSWPS